MMTDTQGIPSHFVKTQRLETLIFFVAVFHLSGQESVKQHDQTFVTGNLSQVRASLGTRPLWQYASSGSSGNNQPFGVSLDALRGESLLFQFVVRFPTCEEDRGDCTKVFWTSYMGIVSATDRKTQHTVTYHLS
jgi:hypothetical protein